ncbi:MAG: FAD-dependent oxidoreductase, partial [Thermoguttaceae bacterium]
MRHWIKTALLGAVMVCWAIAAPAAEVDTSQLKPFGPEMEGFRKPPRETKMLVDGFLWIDAEDFADYGGWRFETQFVYNMGSPYLLAGGTGKPVANARTTVEIPKPGKYRLWVRAKNWHPPHAPGQFQVLVNDRPADKLFGTESHNRWTWCSAGDFDLPAARTTLTLADQTGYFARCDALLLTTDLAYTPPEDLEAIQKERSRLTGLSLEPRQGGSFDVVVVGAGTAGCSAAIAAARNGAKTALVQNRPVLGGNASVELGVGVNGAGSHQANARESGIVEEAGRIQAYYSQPRVSESYRILAEQEKNLTVFVNRHVFAVDMADKKNISAVRALDALTGEIYVYQGRHFIDCTGDGWVGYYAGAKYRFGRESSDEFGEDLAPKQADQITMSGCLMGNMAISFHAQDVGRQVDYTPPPWAAKLPTKDFGRTIRRVTGGEWWLEHEGTVDDLNDPEFARDELIRITFGYWDYLKNHWEGRSVARTFDLVYVPHGDAKRETRRLVGDYLLTQSDVLQATMFPDRISYGGWSVDIHHPEGIYSGAEGPYDFDPRTPIYSIPYRCLYSINIDNLQFAGRHVSVTHVALGTVRVQSTLATLGQATGTAAAMCLRYGVTPRALGRDRIAELQQTLLKQDQYIPNLPNEDPGDVARRAKVSASSSATHEIFDRENVVADDSHPLNMPRAVMFPRGIHGQLKSVWALLENSRSEPVQVTAHLRGAPESGDFSSDRDLAAASAVVPPGKRSFVEFVFNAAVDSPMAWVWLEKTEGLSWRLMASGPYNAARAYGGSGGRPWTVVKGQYYGIYTDPPLTYEVQCQPQNVINGVARVVDRSPNQWASDPTQPMPQWIELEFPEPTTINTVYLTFDTNMNTSHHTA